MAELGVPVDGNPLREADRNESRPRRNRNWLDYLLGPHLGAGISNVLRGAAEFSIGADVREYRTAVGRAVTEARAGRFGQAAGHAGLAAATIPMLFMPGTTASVKKGTDLAMDEASRMARAREMGFDETIRYHQTNPAAKREILEGGFDPSVVGARWSDWLMPDGIFMKSSKKRIPGLGGGTQMPLMTRATKTKDFADRASMESFLKKDKEWASLKQQLDGLESDFVKMGDVIDSGEMSPRELMKDVFDVDYTDDDPLGAIDNLINNVRATVAARMRFRSREFLKEKGYDSVHIASDVGSAGVTDTFIVFDERMARSPDATFDPSKRASSDLLAFNDTARGNPLSNAAARRA